MHGFDVEIEEREGAVVRRETARLVDVVRQERVLNHLRKAWEAVEVAPDPPAEEEDPFLATLTRFEAQLKGELARYSPEQVKGGWCADLLLDLAAVTTARRVWGELGPQLEAHCRALRRESLTLVAEVLNQYHPGNSVGEPFRRDDPSMMVA